MGWPHRILNLFRSQRLSREIDAEMAAHLAERTDDLMAQGMTAGEAAAEARRRFGNRTTQQESTREADSFAWIESLMADIRYGMRALRMSPGFTLVAIASLALGIGANTAIFSLINSLALRSLPVIHPEQLVLVNMGGDGGGSFTNPLWEQLRAQQAIFASSLAYSGTTFNLATGGEVERAEGSWVSGSYFQMLGVRPAAGRLLQPADDVRGCRAVAAVSAGFAARRFGGAAEAVGQTVSLEGHPFEVVGVADPAFTGVEVGRRDEIFAPICSQVIVTGEPDFLEQRSRWYLSILARPREGMPLAEVRSRLAIAARGIFESTLPADWNADHQRDYLSNTLNAVPGAGGQSEYRDTYRKALLVLMVVSGAVLLIACANIANLLLARAAARQREMAIRLAIGAGRFRLLRQLLTESLLLSAAGMVLSVWFALWASRLMVRFLSAGGASLWLDLSLDVRVLGFTVAIAGVTAILFGLAPAWRASRVNPQVAMKSGGRSLTDGGARHRLGKGLVMGQLALSLVLIAAAALLLGSFRKLTTVDLGFRREGVVLVKFNLVNAGYPREQRIPQAMEILRRLREVTGVESVSGSLLTPISHAGWNNDVRAPGFAPTNRRDSLAYFNQVTDGYFATMHSRLLSGRDISAADIAGGRSVAVINARFAHKVFGMASPLGRTFQTPEGDGMSPPREVIGVVEDAKYLKVDEVTPPTAFLPMGVGGQEEGLSYEIRTARPMAELMTDVKAVARSMSPAISLQATTLADQVSSTLKRPRLLAVLSGFFGGLALLLAMIGLYGTIAYSVARRRNEIGVRMALGASKRQVVQMVVGDAGRIVLVGLVLGGALTLATTRVLASFLFGVSANDPFTLVGSGVALALTALAAASVPALRAARLSPTEAIRHE